MLKRDIIFDRYVQWVICRINTSLCPRQTFSSSSFILTFYFWRKSPMPPNTQDWLISAVCCVCVRRCTTDPDLTLSSWGGGGFGTDAGEDVKQWTEITELLSRCRLIRSETHVFYTLWLKRVLLSHFYCFINDRFTITFSVTGHLTPCSLCDNLPHTCSWDAH